MPELPEVETVRRMLEQTVVGRRIQTVRLSRFKLREGVSPTIPRRVRGRSIATARRHGKYLLLDLEGGLTLISHLGMSGRWLFHPGAPPEELPHVHVRIRFADRAALWFQDPRRFGLLRLAPTARLAQDPSLALLGPDPLAEPPSGAALRARARG